MASASFLETHTSQQQHDLELKVAGLYSDLQEYEGTERDELLLLLRHKHARYLQGGLGQLPGGFISLDASRPWICYWVLHGLALLEAPLPAAITPSEVVSFLRSCQHPTGGYGGGPGQLPHLAPTYAAVSALVTLGGQEALSSIDRQGVWSFLNRVAVPPEEGGGFRMHEGGECDVRSCYTALAVATHLQLDVAALVAKSGVVDYIRRCQTYEGGIGGEPGNEAHGGYTFCGLSALCLAGCPAALDLPRLLHWAVQRQGWVEGGFNGRTNKLVDGCYSFWQGGVFPLLQELVAGEGQQQQQVPVHLDACCASPSYPPRTAPTGWQQQQEQCELVVPPLPDLSRVLGPVEQAELEAERLNAACEALAEAALSSSTTTTAADNNNPEAAVAAASGSTASCPDSAAAAAGAAGSGEVLHESRQHLLQRAQAAEKAAEYADENVRIAAASAAVLYPCTAAVPDLAAAAAAAADGGNEQQQQQQRQQGDCWDKDSNPFFNTDALQCWILRACQQLKGGLRDKPGKHADYYHSCYCLSGLSAAQHIKGGRVLGTPEQSPAEGRLATAGVGSSSSMSTSNRLAQADPLLNVVVGKLQEARAFFSAAAESKAATPAATPTAQRT